MERKSINVNSPNQIINRDEEYLIKKITSADLNVKQYYTAAAFFRQRKSLPTNKFSNGCIDAEFSPEISPKQDEQPEPS